MGAERDIKSRPVTHHTTHDIAFNYRNIISHKYLLIKSLNNYI